MTDALMLGFLAETPVHPGAGSNLGVVDLPVAREGATDYPVVVGSSLKGALRDRARAEDEAGRWFGERDRAGDVLVSDGRLLLLPVRSLTGNYRWLTCPFLVERYGRDLRRAGLGPVPQVPTVEAGKVLTAGQGHLVLEERQFEVAGPAPEQVIESVQRLIFHQETKARLKQQVALVCDDDFAWFVRYAVPVQARNVLNEDKQSDNLWYEESLPADTVLYCLLLGRTAPSLEGIKKLFSDESYLQVGGNETVGQGWLAVTVSRRQS